MKDIKHQIEKLEEEGYIISSRHPYLPLTIYNYSVKTQYEKYWNDITLMCRGLVIDDNGKIVARPFPKFFNMEEEEVNLPDLPYEVYEKVDGSLGIFFWYENFPVFASRGSFTTEQAVKGFELLKKLPYHDLSHFHTYMFEIVYPENRIVVNYGSEEKLVLLGVIKNSNGQEVPRKNIEEHLGEHFELVNVYNYSESFIHLKSLNNPNSEGFVIRFSNGYRIKIKFADYVRLHALMTNITNRTIWEALKDGIDILELIKDTPDEYYNKIHSYVKDLRYANYSIREYYGKCHDSFRFGKYGDKEPEPNKKQYAEFVHSNIKKELHFIMFLLWNRKNCEDAIWKLIKPSTLKKF